MWLLLPGGSFPFTVGRIEHGHKVRPDLCAVDNKISPRKYLGSFYTDSLVHDPVSLKLLVDVIGKVSTCFLKLKKKITLLCNEELLLVKDKVLCFIQVAKLLYTDKSVELDHFIWGGALG